jgi:hypothetical protein
MERVLVRPLSKRGSVIHHLRARGARDGTSQARCLISRAMVVFVGLGLGLWGVVAPPASAKAPPSIPATLDGESFSGVPTFSNQLCSPNGTSRFDYSVTGVAGGPYAGTFSETGSVSVTPQTIRQETSVGLGTLEYTSGSLASLNATFTIQSSAGTVTGTKTLAVSGDGFAACQNSAEFRSDLLPSQTVLIALRRAHTTGLAYSATIPVGKRTYCDSGTSTLALNGFATADFGEIEPASLSETFASAGDSVVRARGHKGC